MRTLAAGPTFQLLPMRWWHLESIASLEAEAFGPTAWSIEQFCGELAADGRWLRVALDDAGAVLGYVDVAVGGRDADLMTIVVAPAAAGRGLGARLLDEALTAAVAAGADQMFLEVRADNPAQRLYERAGFAQIDLRRGYYGPGEDAVVMRRALPAAQETAASGEEVRGG
jgi:ribosomal-protein-alanine acetyltransferase